MDVLSRSTPITVVSRENADAGRAPIALILLAAGAGSRFRDVGHKLMAELPEHGIRQRETVFLRSLAAAVEAEIGPVTVITGRLGASDLGIGDRIDVTAVHNPDWATGQMSSVQAGVNVADQNGADIVVIGLADQPGIESSAWRAVADAARAGAQIAVATYDGRRANPVALHRDVWNLLATAGDEGARGLMRLRQDLVVEVPCTGSPKDIDTVEDLTRWQSN